MDNNKEEKLVQVLVNGQITLAGIKFPRSKDDLVEYAGYHLDNREEVEYTNEVLNILDQLPTKEYSNMADVEREVGRLK